MDQQRRESIWTDLIRVTPSSVGDLLGCPKRFAETRILKNWGLNNRTFPEAVAHGTATHSVLKDVFRAREDGHLDLFNLGALARTAVYRGRYPVGFDRIVAVDRVVEAVCTYVAQEPPEDVRGTVDLEHQGEFPYIHAGVPLYLVSATLDRVLVRESEPRRLVVKEYKTARPKISLPEVLIALWVAKKTHPDYDSWVMEIEHIGDGTVVRDVIEGHDLRGQHRLITEAALSVIRDGHWPACPGENCTYCHLRPICSGLPPEELFDGEDIF